MFQFTTVYYRVDDQDKLESFFASTHRALAEQLPGLVKIEVSRVTGKPGGESRFHLAYSLYFATAASFQRSLTSEAGIQLMQALKAWYDAGLIAWYYGDAYEEYVKGGEDPLQDADLLPPG